MVGSVSVAGDALPKASAGLLAELADAGPPPSGRRYCFIPERVLEILLENSDVLEGVMDMLRVPGKLDGLRAMSVQEKRRVIEEWIEVYSNFRTSVWFGVLPLEVIAATVFRSAEAQAEWRQKFKLLTRTKVLRDIFREVSREEDLRPPVEQ